MKDKKPMQPSPEPLESAGAGSRREFLRRLAGAASVPTVAGMTACATTGATTQSGRRRRRPDPQGPVPKNLRQRMKWDLNRLAWEVRQRLARGDTFSEIGKWLDPLEKGNVSKRQFVGKVPHESEAHPSPHFLRVVVDQITWKVDGTTNKAVGFVLKGCVFRHKKTEAAVDGRCHPKGRGKPPPVFSLTSYYSSSSSISSTSVVPHPGTFPKGDFR